MLAQRCEQWERDEHLQSLEDVPRAVLPAGPAREALRRMAADGHDVEAYRPIGADWARGNVWVGPLDRGIGRRVPIADWVRDWVRLLAEIGTQLADADAGDVEGASDA